MTQDTILIDISKKFPKLFAKELIKDDLIFRPENDAGFIEYKRTLINCHSNKKERYATQMQWRINENTKNFAIYYIGLDDDGTVVGINTEDILSNIEIFINISNLISASIMSLKILSIKEKIVLKFKIKLKNKKQYLENILDFVNE